MKASDFLNSSPVLIEITQDSLKALDRDASFETAIERGPDGRVTEAYRQQLVAALSGFLKRTAFVPRRKALCAIPARGVSLRHLTLPSCPRDEIERLLLLQIESEFPIPPDQLAWGWEILLDSASGTNQEILVVAVKRETVEDYSAILSQCGLVPAFTVAGLARSFLLSHPSKSYSILEIQPNYSELVAFENGIATSLRVFHCGSRNTDAELISLIPASVLGTKAFLSGDPIQARLGSIFSAAISFEPLPIGDDQGRSAAIAGLKSSCEENVGRTPLLLQTSGISTVQSLARPLHLKWAALAAVLAFCALSLRYAEAVLRQPHLEKQLAELNAYRAKLPNIDRELNFLQFLQTNQPPYLDRLYVLANAAQPGTRVESLGMSRRGDLTLRVGMQNSQQLTDFRTKLIDSGFFSSVVVEEQTPSPDRQKLSVRLTGIWKPSIDRKALEAPPSITPKASESKPVSTNKTSLPAASTNQPSQKEMKK